LPFDKEGCSGGPCTGGGETDFGAHEGSISNGYRAGGAGSGATGAVAILPVSVCGRVGLHQMPVVGRAVADDSACRPTRRVVLAVVLSSATVDLKRLRAAKVHEATTAPAARIVEPWLVVVGVVSTRMPGFVAVSTAQSCMSRCPLCQWQYSASQRPNGAGPP